MAPKIVLVFLWTILVQLLGMTSAGQVPLPPENGKLELKYCKTINETVTAAVIGPCVPGHVVGTKSPCPYGCIAPYEHKAGDPCDPLLFTFLRRKYDDAQPNMRDWVTSKTLVGSNFDPSDADYKYKGECIFLCPRALCLDVYHDTQAGPGDVTQFVDIHKWDCLSTHLVNKYLGVCSCGHNWAKVDPANSGRTFDRKTELVKYRRTIGLDRKLQWDSSKKRCAADRYGHCSLDWDPNIPTEQLTFCWDPEHRCVNRTASHLGISYRPFETLENGVNGKPRWYGICDTEVLIQDPFAGAAGVAARILGGLAKLIAGGLGLIFVWYSV